MGWVVAMLGRQPAAAPKPEHPLAARGELQPAQNGKEEVQVLQVVRNWGGCGVARARSEEQGCHELRGRERPGPPLLWVQVGERAAPWGSRLEMPGGCGWLSGRAGAKGRLQAKLALAGCGWRVAAGLLGAGEGRVRSVEPSPAQHVPMAGWALSPCCRSPHPSGCWAGGERAQRSASGLRALPAPRPAGEPGQ